MAAMCSSLDDVSKSLGLLLFSVLVDQLGGFIIAFQFVLVFWILSGLLLVPITDSFLPDMLNMQKVLQQVSDETKLREEKGKAETSLLRRFSNN